MVGLADVVAIARDQLRIAGVRRGRQAGLTLLVVASGSPAGKHDQQTFRAATPIIPTCIVYLDLSSNDPEFA